MSLGDMSKDSKHTHASLRAFWYDRCCLYCRYDIEDFRPTAGKGRTSGATSGCIEIAYY